MQSTDLERRIVELLSDGRNRTKDEILGAVGWYAVNAAVERLKDGGDIKGWKKDEGQPWVYGIPGPQHDPSQRQRDEPVPIMGGDEPTIAPNDGACATGEATESHRPEG